VQILEAGRWASHFGAAHAGLLIKMDRAGWARPLVMTESPVEFPCILQVSGQSAFQILKRLIIITIFTPSGRK